VGATEEEEEEEEEERLRIPSRIMNIYIYIYITSIYTTNGRSLKPMDHLVSHQAFQYIPGHLNFCQLRNIIFVNYNNETRSSGQRSK
jgi:hypothetical protein